MNGVANGWQLSGVTQLESGANLTYQGMGGGGTNQINGNFNAAYTCVVTAAEKAAGISCPQSAAIIPGSISTANPTGIAISNQSIYGSNLASNAQGPIPIVTCDPRGHVGAHSFVNGNCLAPPTAVVQGQPKLLPAVYGPAFFDSDLAVFKNFQIKEGMKLQLRAQAYNFLNHPLYSFPSGNNLTLQFTQDPVSQAITQANPNFGKTTQKEGSRIIEFGAKFFF